MALLPLVLMINKAKEEEDEQEAIKTAKRSKSTVNAIEPIAAHMVK